MRLKSSIALAATLSAGSVLLWSGQAQAQQRSGSAAAMLEEVVVTARRREEGLQDLPLSIAAMTADQMEVQGIHDMEAVGEFVPNVTLTTSDRANNTRVVIRGIGGGAPDPVEVFGSGMYIDGHYMPNSQGGFMSTLDIERVELLRGPQGTLFGKNVTGGAVNIISAKPGPEFDSRLTLRAAEHGQQDVRGMINFPINDTTFARVSVAKETTDGYYYNRNLDIDTNGTDLSAITGAIRFTPGNWLVDVSGTLSERRDDNRGGQCSTGDGDPPQWGGGTGHVNRIYDGALADFQASCDIDVAAGPFVNSSDKVTWSNVDTEGLFASAQWDSDGAVGGLESLTVKMNASYRYYEYTYFQDRDFNEFAIDAIGSVGPKGANNRTRGAEFILEGDASERLSFTAGVNYFKEIHFDGTNTCYTNFANAGGADIDPDEVVTCPLEGLHFELLPEPRDVAGGPGPFMSNKSVWNESLGIFGHLTYALNDDWDLDFGLRWTEDEREFNNIEWASQGCDVGSNPGGITGHCTFTAPMTYQIVIEEGYFNQAEDTWTEITPMISLTRNLGGGPIIDDGMVYFLYSEGFLTGGFNTEINSNLPDTLPLLTYDPEQVRNYEVGFKGTLAGGNVQIMSALFFMDYTDKQDDIDIDNPDGLYGIDDPLGIRTNVSSVDIYGVEFELRASPWDGGFLSLDVGYLKNEFSDYKYTDPEDPDNIIDNSNLGVADLSPEWTVNLGLEHEFQLVGGGTLTPRIGAYWQDDYEWLAADRTTDAPPSFCNQKDYVKTSARVTYRPAAGNWRASLFGNNLNDQRIYEFCNSTRTIYVYRYERPRHWGLEFTANFGRN